MQDIPALPWAETAIGATRRLLTQESFGRQHRINDKAFTRERCFTFGNTMLFLMQKTLRSIQLHVHAFFGTLAWTGPGPTASAWSQARLKLQHSAFIALNELALLPVVYRDRVHPTLRLWRGYRLLAIDSSLVRLPNREPLGKEFGWVECSNQQGDAGRYPQARLSVLTDVLNRIAVQTFWVPWKVGERDLALDHLQRLEPGDLALLDRGFAEYPLWAQFVRAQRTFVCRCQASSFKIVNELFAANQAGRSVRVELSARHLLGQLRQAGLPETILLRFVTVRLNTGELEVLATNLLDETLYPTEAFALLYHYRWGIETYYLLLKSRLDLGHFTGLSSEAIRQDVYATIFLSNLESLLIVPANAQLQAKSQALKNRQQVNHAVSFHAIKSQLLALLTGSESLPQVMARLQELFLATPVAVRPERKVPRQKPSTCRSYAYQRYVKKIVF
jgi:hypothetical protein